MKLLATLNEYTTPDNLWFDAPESFNGEFDKVMCENIQKAQDMLVQNEPESASFKVKIPLSKDFERELFSNAFDSMYFADSWIEISCTFGDLTILLVMQTAGDFSCLEYKAVPYITWSEVLNDVQ